MVLDIPRVNGDISRNLMGPAGGADLRRVAFNLDSNRTHYTYASDAYDRAYNLDDSDQTMAFLGMM